MIGEVSNLLGLSRTRLVQLDDVLEPRRGLMGVRLYDPEVVDRYHKERTVTKRRAIAKADDSQLIDERQLAEIVHLSVSYLQKSRIRGDGPAWIRLGRGKGRIRYRLSDVHAWVASQVQR